MALIGNQTRKVYSFKSVGTVHSGSVSETEAIPAKKPPIGIKTPLQITAGQGLFDMHTDVGKLISDNLRNLILTNHGERLGFYDFGANLRPLVFELGSENGDVKAIQRIRQTVGKYMPFVTLINFQPFVDHNDNKEVAKVGIQITYKIPKLDNYTRSLEVMLYVGG